MAGNLGDSLRIARRLAAIAIFISQSWLVSVELRVIPSVAMDRDLSLGSEEYPMTKRTLSPSFLTIATLLMATTAIAPTVASAAVYRNGDQVILDPGTVIPVTLNDELSSSRSEVGDTFTANVDTSRDAYNSLLSGAVVEGVVRDVTPQSGNDPGTLKVAFTRLRLLDGSSTVISGKPTSLDSKNLTVGSNGLLVAKAGAKDQSLTYAGIGAGAGALISLLGGGKLKIEDLLIGGGLGYVAGQIMKQKNQEVHNVDLKPGTPMGVLLGDTVMYHRRGWSTSNSGSMAPLKLYTYNGQQWSYNPNTGERRLMEPIARTTTTVTRTRTFHRSNRKYYSFNGHPYFLDLNTGERVRLD